MCVLGQPEPVDSVLMFLSGYDTLEYTWMKTTVVSVRLRILFVTLQNTNMCRELKVAGELTSLQVVEEWFYILPT